MGKYTIEKDEEDEEEHEKEELDMNDYLKVIIEPQIFDLNTFILFDLNKTAEHLRKWQTSISITRGV